MTMITAMITPRGSASTMTMTLDKIPIPNSISNKILRPIPSLIPDKILNTIPIPEPKNRFIPEPDSDPDPNHDHEVIYLFDLESETKHNCKQYLVNFIEIKLIAHLICNRERKKANQTKKDWIRLLKLTQFTQTIK